MSKKVTKGNGKMGYSQNFGPTRMNGYASGSKKVEKIMSNGPIAKVAGPGDGILGKAAKVARTITRGLGDIATQGLDLLQPDVNKIGSSGRMSNVGTGLGSVGSARKEARNAKKRENKHYAKSRELAKQGKTYGSLANFFDDDGKGNSIKK